ncbi:MULTISPECIES: polysaccharide pyruvyl transferase family protein [Sphingomonas]|uniref:Polysaccharide pyruvyl transferase family protein n=1 Tax=Sphingomonas molluscorum TaxID=418184 RepID=A0ABU8Q7S1_9SPHN|nr:polysaccharide pyruvyl transferase family protein [Sphingomonas sp. JUb134]MBM7407141.1 polysaccharide pyruvyl transferase WcaK-like protein [Sphingomonas sp. JUb134]
MPNVFLIGDTSNRYNWGCRATTFQLRRMIEEVGTIAYALDTKFLNAPLTPAVQTVEKHPQNTIHELGKSYPPFLKTIAQRAIFKLSPLSLARIRALATHISPSSLPALAKGIKERKLFPNIAEAMERSDIVLINGEGSLMQDRGVGKLKLLFAYTAKEAFGKPTAIVNHTADFRNPALRRVAARVYPVLDDIVVREAHSMQMAKQIRPQDRLDFAADAAFLWSPASELMAKEEYSARHMGSEQSPHDASSMRGFDPAGSYICIGGSSAFSGKEGRFEELREAYRRLCGELGRIAPVVVTASSAPDEQILRPLADELRLPYLGLSTEIQQAVDVLGRAKAYVGGRWHPGILALTGGTPVVSFSANSDFKSRGLTELAGLAQDPIQASSIQGHLDTIVETTRAYVTEGEALRTRIKDRVAQLTATCRRNVRLVQEHAST